MLFNYISRPVLLSVFITLGHWTLPYSSISIGRMSQAISMSLLGFKIAALNELSMSSFLCLPTLQAFSHVTPKSNNITTQFCSPTTTSYPFTLPNLRQASGLLQLQHTSKCISSELRTHLKTHIKMCLMCQRNTTHTHKKDFHHLSRA